MGRALAKPITPNPHPRNKPKAKQGLLFVNKKKQKNFMNPAPTADPRVAPERNPDHACFACYRMIHKNAANTATYSEIIRNIH
jgi:hypothetical protein